jgi:hypothetical protein
MSCYVSLVALKSIALRVRRDLNGEKTYDREKWALDCKMSLWKSKVIAYITKIVVCVNRIAGLLRSARQCDCGREVVRETRSFASS